MLHRSRAKGFLLSFIQSTKSIQSETRFNPNSAHQHFLCILEHNPPAYTVGLREGLYSAGEEQRIRALGAEFHRSLPPLLLLIHQFPPTLFTLQRQTRWSDHIPWPWPAGSLSGQFIQQPALP